MLVQSELTWSLTRREDRNDSFGPLKYLWIGSLKRRNDRRRHRVRAQSGGSYSDSVGTRLLCLLHFPFSLLTLFSLPPFLSLSLILLWVLSRFPSLLYPDKPPMRRARTPFGGSAPRFSLGSPTTEKQDGDLWVDVGRSRPFNRLPKRLNFVADPAISTPASPTRRRLFKAQLSSSFLR